MRFVDVTTYIGNAEIVITCGLVSGSVESVQPYVKGKFIPKLIAWAEKYVDSNEGSWAVCDACHDAGVRRF
jgi:hypothetical protein